jgi:hypothetical protein
MRCLACEEPVPHGKEIVTDLGPFHDTERCLPTDLYEAIVWLYSDHLEVEHADDVKGEGR